jgi:hypothetical protein
VDIGKLHKIWDSDSDDNEAKVSKDIDYRLGAPGSLTIMETTDSENDLNLITKDGSDVDMRPTFSDTQPTSSHGGSSPPAKDMDYRENKTANTDTFKDKDERQKTVFNQPVDEYPSDDDDNYDQDDDVYSPTDPTGQDELFPATEDEKPYDPSQPTQDLGVSSTPPKKRESHSDRHNSGVVGIKVLPPIKSVTQQPPAAFPGLAPRPGIFPTPAGLRPVFLNPVAQIPPLTRIPLGQTPQTGVNPTNILFQSIAQIRPFGRPTELQNIHMLMSTQQRMKNHESKSGNEEDNMAVEPMELSSPLSQDYGYSPITPDSGHNVPGSHSKKKVRSHCISNRILYDIIDIKFNNFIDLSRSLYTYISPPQ